MLRLYLFIFLIGALITATLSLDATAIVLTPIVYAMAIRLKLKPLPFMFACSFIANTASLFMPISNLTNLLIYRSLDFSFLRFSLIMLIPAVAAVTTNAMLFSYLFRWTRRSLHAAGHAVSSSQSLLLPALGRWARRHPAGHLRRLGHASADRAGRAGGGVVLLASRGRAAGCRSPIRCVRSPGI